MRRSRPFAFGYLCAWCVLALFGVGGAVARAGELVAVFVRDGRILTGSVDGRTNATELWLHSAEPSILILSSIPWSDVTAAKVSDTTLTTEEFRKRTESLKAPLPLHVFQKRRPLAPKRVLTAIPAVQSLEIVPEIANWKRGVAPDGLEIRLNPLGADGNPVPAEGMVTVRLLGRRVGRNDRLQSSAPFGFWTDGSSVREYSTRLNNASYVELGRWSERLSAKEASGSGYLLRFPYRKVNPERDLDIALDGMLDVHFSVDGQGIHEATAPLQLRAFSPFREELQRERGSRYLPDEF